MRVILVNGSPNEKGCTYTALKEIEKILIEEGIDTQIFWIGKSIGGCMACRACAKTGKCVIDASVNEFVKTARTADGFVFGSPVHYAAASGNLTSFMDRAFFSGKGAFAFKPAACVVSARRAGTTAAFEQINKYFTISQMPVISSKYWNMVHGSNPDDVAKDKEGLQTMRVLARNIAWFLKLREAGDKAGIPLPKQEESIEHTNFIR